MASLCRALVLAGAACSAVPVAGAEGLAVVTQGVTRYRIVMPAQASAAVVYAAGELQTFVRQATGVTLPTAAEAGVAEVAPTPAFFIGPTRRAVAAGLTERAEGLGPDGVLLKSLGEDVFLLGHDERGHLYSVYTFLERYLGCRFLARDCTVVPTTPDLRLPEIDLTYSPPFIYRECLYHDAADWPFAARQRLNGANMKSCLGRSLSATEEVAAGVLILPFVHSAAYMVPPGKYHAEHPEYFALVGGKRTSEVISGQLCYTNPDVLRICTEETLRLFREHPETTSVDLSQNDSWPDRSGACECDACLAIVREEGAQHGPILRFTNAIADVVAKEFPGRYVDTLAYAYSVATPKVTRPRDNVIIRLCHHACYFHGIEGETLGAEFRGAVEDWCRVAKNVFVWHYGTNFWHYLAPNPNLVPLAKDVKYYHAHGVNGLMLQGNIQSSGGELAEVRQYLAAQLMWDPTRDPMPIRREFCEGYYGSAAPEVLEFLAAMDAWGTAIDKHIPMNGWNPPDVTPAAFVASSLAILDRARAQAGDEVVRNRVDKLFLPFWYLQLSWPDMYGLAKADGQALVGRFRDVCKANEITTIAEGPPNVDAFLARMEAAFQ